MSYRAAQRYNDVETGDGSRLGSTRMAVRPERDERKEPTDTQTLSEDRIA